MVAVFVSFGDPTEAQLEEEAVLRRRVRALEEQILAAPISREERTRLRNEVLRIDIALDEAILAIDEMAAGMALDEARGLLADLVPRVARAEGSSRESQPGKSPAKQGIDKRWLIAGGVGLGVVGLALLARRQRRRRAQIAGLIPCGCQG